jgi:hypothetical protein
MRRSMRSRSISGWRRISSSRQPAREELHSAARQRAPEGREARLALEGVEQHPERLAKAVAAELGEAGAPARGRFEARRVEPHEPPRRRVAEGVQRAHRERQARAREVVDGDRVQRVFSSGRPRPREALRRQPGVASSVRDPTFVLHQIAAHVREHRVAAVEGVAEHRRRGPEHAGREVLAVACLGRPVEREGGPGGLREPTVEPAPCEARGAAVRVEAHDEVRHHERRARREYELPCHASIGVLHQERHVLPRCGGRGQGDEATRLGPDVGLALCGLRGGGGAERERARSQENGGRE